MAIIKLGPIVSDIKGLVNGLIFARNIGGNYVKGFVTPINPMTTRQVDVRNDFATLVDDWQSRLSQGERLGWNDYGQNNPVLNRLGEQILLTGLNWFIKLNALRLQAGGAVVDDAPVGSSTGIPDTSLDISDIDLDGATIDIAFDITGNWVGQDAGAMLIFVPDILSLGVESFNHPMRFAGAIQGDATTPPTSPATLAYPWGGPTGGGKVFCEATIIEDGPKQTVGSRSPMFFA